MPGMFRVHDYVHGARIAEISRGLQSGHFPVRWSENFGYGYGMPLFNFYAPLPYYLGSIVYWLTGDIVVSVKSLFLIIQIGTVIGGYCVGKHISRTHLGGLVGAATLGFIPYRAVNMFVRGALSESFAMMGVVWILLGLIGILYSFNPSHTHTNLTSFKEVRDFILQKKWFLLSLCVGSLIVLLSHNLSALLTFGLVAFFLVTWLLSTIFKGAYSSVIKSIIAGCAVVMSTLLSSFYILPMFFEKSHIRTDVFLDGYFDYRLHFLYIRQFFDPTWGYGGSTYGPDDDISFFLGWPFFTTVLLLLVVVLSMGIQYLVSVYHKGITQSHAHSHTQLHAQSHTHLDTLFHYFQLLFVLGLTVAMGLFMTLQRSDFIWEHLPLIENLQFPWRFLGFASVGLGVITIVLYASIEKLIHNSHRYIKGAIPLLIIFAALSHVSTIQPEFWLDDPSELYYSDPVRIRTEMSETMYDYIPSTLQLVGTKADFIPETNGADTNTINGVGIRESLHPVYALQSIGSDPVTGTLESIQVMRNDPHHKVIALSAPTDTEIIWAIANFPGWTSIYNDTTVEQFTTESGLLAVRIPAGEARVEVIFQDTPMRSRANAISAVTFFVTIVLIGGILLYKK